MCQINHLVCFSVASSINMYLFVPNCPQTRPLYFLKNPSAIVSARDATSASLFLMNLCYFFSMIYELQTMAISLVFLSGSNLENKRKKLDSTSITFEMPKYSFYI